MRRTLLLASLLVTTVVLGAGPGSAAYDAGYKRGHAQGVDQGRRPGYGMPNDVGMRLMSENHCSAAGFANSPDCTKGFSDGFATGYRTKRPFTRKAENYEALSWANAAPGTKLFNYSEAFEVTITAVNKAAGTIQVRYQKTGALETKQLSAVASYWWVRRPAPRK